MNRGEFGGEHLCDPLQEGRWQGVNLLQSVMRLRFGFGGEEKKR